MTRRIILCNASYLPRGWLFQGKTYLFATIDILNRWSLCTNLPLGSWDAAFSLVWWVQSLLKGGDDVGLPSDPVCDPLPTLVCPGNLTCMWPYQLRLVGANKSLLYRYSDCWQWYLLWLTVVWTGVSRAGQHRVKRHHQGNNWSTFWCQQCSSKSALIEIMIG